MKQMAKGGERITWHVGMLVAVLALVGVPALLHAAPVDLTLTVEGSDGTPITTGFRWLLQENLMYDAKQGIPCDPTGNDLARPCIPGTTEGTYGRPMRSGKFEMTPSTPMASAR